MPSRTRSSRSTTSSGCRRDPAGAMVGIRPTRRCCGRESPTSDLSRELSPDCERRWTGITMRRRAIVDADGVRRPARRATSDDRQRRSACARAICPQNVRKHASASTVRVITARAATKYHRDPRRRSRFDMGSVAALGRRNVRMHVIQARCADRIPSTYALDRRRYRGRSRSRRGLAVARRTDERQRIRRARGRRCSLWRAGSAVTRI